MTPQCDIVFPGSTPNVTTVQPERGWDLKQRGEIIKRVEGVSVDLGRVLSKPGCFATKGSSAIWPAAMTPLL